jgi:hypothetical protein
VRRLSLLLALALLALAAPVASAADRCNARGAKTVLKNSQARLFYVKGKGKVKKRFYGCVRGGKPILVTSDVHPKGPEQTTATNTQFRLAGRFVAWTETFVSDFGVGEFGRSIRERALERGHRQISQDVSDYRGVGALAVRADGAVAWILLTGSTYDEVDGLGSAATQPTPFAYARGIDAKSLRLDARSVFWTQDGSERSGALP